MTALIIGVDLADAVFELAIANVQFEIQQRKRSSRLRFTLFCEGLPPSPFLMEACNTAHHWARTLTRWGHEVRLLPAPYVRPYVHRSKSDAADAAAPLHPRGLTQPSNQRRARLRAVGIEPVQSGGIVA
jgi:transposase